MKEISLPSGAVLKILQTPFAESKALYQTILKELKTIPFDSKSDVASLIKNVFCSGFSSKEVEVALDVCLKRCLYNDLKIDEKTFEASEARQDYTKVCIEVIQENIGPFLKGLYAEFGRVSMIISSVQT